MRNPVVSKEVLIRFVNISKAFGGKVVLDGLTLDVNKGETVTIIGGSGTGKSVTLKVLLGLLPADSGDVYYKGQNITHFSEKEYIPIRTNISMLFQSGALFDSLTVGENVAYSLREHTKMTEAEIKKTIAQKLELVDLPGTEDLMPSELSGGMRKRVGLARAIALTPEAILYDEPTTGLDPITANVINRLIIRMQEVLHVTSIVVTHDMASAYIITDRIAMLYKGKILETGYVKDIRELKNPIVQEFITGGENADHKGERAPENAVHNEA